jgi:hypothetical protein
MMLLNIKLVVFIMQITSAEHNKYFLIGPHVNLKDERVCYIFKIKDWRKIAKLCARLPSFHGSGSNPVCVVLIFSQRSSLRHDYLLAGAARSLAVNFSQTHRDGTLSDDWLPRLAAHKSTSSQKLQHSPPPNRGYEVRRSAIRRR